VKEGYKNMRTGKYLEGSKWWKWDLHVHTPFSIVNYYHGTCEDEKWENFIKDLEALPEKFKVIGINDYLFIDGYRKILEYKKNGRLENIDLILPVLEFRIEKFAGHKEFKRINFHVIFSDELSPDIIQSQFLNALTTKYKLSPGLNGVAWSGTITKDSLVDLGRSIKENIPAEKLGEYGKDIEEGFNNLNLNEEDILQILNSNTYLKGKFLTAIGKTEWESLSWNDQSIAEKKDIINKVNFVFISSESVDVFQRAKNKLREQRVNDLLLDCSDAHYNLNSKEKDRIGNCFTWIKADPTFEGLKQILYETDERVFIGDEPELLQRVRENKTKFIKTIKINHVEGHDEKNGIWFKNIEIPLNLGMVAIIGHKGSGKSALLDIIALCGNSYQEEKDFSFLNEKRFKKGGLAKNFEAVLDWENGEQITKNLNYITDKTAPERVKYLPQNYFERLTNSLDSYEFGETLNNVVFSHLPEEQKMGKNSFEELISYKKEIIEGEIKNIIKVIESYNEKINVLEKKEYPNYLEKIKNELELKKKELKEHEKNKPQEVSKPQEENKNTKKLQKLKEQLEKNGNNIKKKYEENKSLLLEIEELNKIKKELSNFKREIDNYISENQEKFEKYKLNSDDLIKIEVNIQLIEELVKSKTKQRNDNFQEIENLEEDKKKIREKEKKIKSTLSEQQHKYEKYLTDLKKWNNKKQEIIGDYKTPNTIKWYKNEINFIKKELQEKINTLRKERVSKSLEIYDKKKELVDIYKSLKDYVEKEISDYQNVLGEYEINIEATLKISGEFYNKFLKYINQKIKGSFRGEDEGLKLLQGLTKAIDPTSKEEIKQFLNKIINYLEYDQREQFKDKKNKEKRRFILDQIPDKNIIAFYRYLFSLDYINATYQLKLGDKELTQLSPGEKGSLLIVFYLMLDKDNIPLLIDQPRLTKNKRQIIIVTHNPNLAIVGDAEQIIFVNIDKKHGNKFSFESGAIENSTINRHASDILEGTLKAFDIRRLKYFGSKMNGKIS